MPTGADGDYATMSFPANATDGSHHGESYRLCHSAPVADQIMRDTVAEALEYSPIVSFDQEMGGAANFPGYNTSSRRVSLRLRVDAAATTRIIRGSTRSRGVDADYARAATVFAQVPWPPAGPRKLGVERLRTHVKGGAFGRVVAEDRGRSLCGNQPPKRRAAEEASAL